MSAQDKAKQLVEKYRTYVRLADKYDLNLGSDEMYIAKECSLLTVDELIKHFAQIEPYLGVEYWREVKTEIEKI